MTEAVVRLLAASADGLGVPNLFNVGAVGTIAALLIVFAKGAYADVKAERDDAKAEVKRLSQLILDTTLAALRESSTALTRATDVLKDVVDEEREKK